MAEVDERKMDFLLLREVVVSLVMEDENFIHRVRNAGPKHPFLDKMPEEGAASVEAVDRFASFLVPFLAQFADTGIPHHSAFKASMVCFALLPSNLCVCAHVFLVFHNIYIYIYYVAAVPSYALCACKRACFFWGGARWRQSWCTLRRPMLSFQKAHA